MKGGEREITAGWYHGDQLLQVADGAQRLLKQGHQGGLRKREKWAVNKLKVISPAPLPFPPSPPPLPSPTTLLVLPATCSNPQHTERGIWKYHHCHHTNLTLDSSNAYKE